MKSSIILAKWLLSKTDKDGISTLIAGTDVGMHKFTYPCWVEPLNGEVVLKRPVNFLKVFKKKPFQNKHGVIIDYHIKHQGKECRAILDNNFNKNGRYYFYDITDLHFDAHLANDDRYINSWLFTHVTPCHKGIALPKLEVLKEPPINKLHHSSSFKIHLIDEISYIEDNGYLIPWVIPKELIIPF